MILRLDSNKNLMITKSKSTIYEGENKAEVLRILLPKQINNISLNNCLINLNILNQDNVGNVLPLSDLTIYSEDSYETSIEITKEYTYKPGKIFIWIDVINPDSEMLAKSSVVSLMINSHMEVSEFIPEQSLALLADLQIKVEKIDKALSQDEEVTKNLTTTVNELKERLDSIETYLKQFKSGMFFMVESVSDKEEDKNGI